MKTPFSPYLAGIAPGLKELAALLRQQYDYVSVLSTDTTGFQVAISQRAKSVTRETLCTERGTVVRVCRNGLYAESAFTGFDSAEAFREDVKQKLADAKAKSAAAANENAVIGKVVENAQIELPEPMIETQVEQLIDDYARRMQGQGLQLDQYMEYTGMTMDKLKEQFHPQAERNLKTRLTLEAVVEAENIQVSEEAIEDEIKRMADQYKIDVEKMHEFLSDDDKKNISMDLKIQEAVDFLVAEAKLV